MDESGIFEEFSCEYPVMPASTHHLIPQSIDYIKKAYEGDGIFSVNALCESIRANRTTFLNSIMPVLTAKQPDGFNITIEKLEGKKGFRVTHMGIIKVESARH
jgi:hypothetical protein